MSRRHRRPQDGNDADQPLPHPAEDCELIEFLCKDLQIDEVPFGDWLQTHHSLDLVITLMLSRSELSAGDKEITVHWTRSLREHASQRSTRKPASKTVLVQAGTRSGHTLLLKGEGDQLAGTSGDLKIIIHIM